MFTGIIEEIGIVTGINRIAGGVQLKIKALKIMDDIKIDDSISVNGVCLTVTGKGSSEFQSDAVGDTLKKTNLSEVQISNEVNLERSVRLIDRLGGHLVQGHVNDVGKITQINQLGKNYLLEVQVPELLEKYIIDEGSISIDGISLTIAKLNGTTISISIIPHTWENTTLKFRKVGDKVNIEVDIIAKYVEKLVRKENVNGTFTANWFKNLGY
ncbi:riboflavin synthase [Bacteroidota bacterium]